MAELLIRVVDKINSDPLKDCKLLKRGDVVAWKPDFSTWASQEVANPDWRIIRVNNLTVAECDNYLAPEPAVDPLHPSRMLRKRGVFLDLSLLTAGEIAAIASRSATMQNPIDAQVSLARVRALVTVKTPLQDPGVIG
jgi:hypothetical protein